MRNKGKFERTISQTAEETILTNNKRIMLNSKMLRGIHHRIIGLADINIINFAGLLRHLTAQKGIVPSISEKGGIFLHHVRRIYHLNLIIHIRKKDEAAINRYRLIADAKGIKRIEHVDSISL